MTETEKRHDAEAEDALHDELKNLRKENNELRRFLLDAAAYLRMASDVGQEGSITLGVLSHDITGLARREPCFLPRVTGYADQPEKKI